MGLLDMIFGRKEAEPRPVGHPVSFGEGPVRLGGQPAYSQAQAAPAPRTADENELALQRYRYMLRTAPPETIEQAHAEAFERMTPEQRAYVLQALASELPEGEQAATQLAHNDPRAMARIATRAEMRSPGVMERTLAAHPAHGHHGGMGGGMLAGMAGTLLMSFAAGFIGSMAATAFLDAMGDPFADVAEAIPEELPVAEESFDGAFAEYDGGFEEF